MIIVTDGRSRKGAWIEIYVAVSMAISIAVAPARERGLKYLQNALFLPMLTVAPARERGLKCNHAVPRLKNLKVAPARERGLKFPYLAKQEFIAWSLPQGSVD